MRALGHKVVVYDISTIIQLPKMGIHYSILNAINISVKNDASNKYQ